MIQRIWRKVEDKGLQKGGQGLEGVYKEVVAEVWRERSGDANKLQIGEKGQTCADEVRWYERGERAKERLEEWKQMVARGGEKQRHRVQEIERTKKVVVLVQFSVFHVQLFFLTAYSNYVVILNACKS